MALVRADRGVCRGFANCVMVAPDYFDLDEDGLVLVLNAKVAQSDQPQVEAAVGSCPVSALQMEKA